MSLMIVSSLPCSKRRQDGERRKMYLIWLLVIYFFLISCGQERNVEFFRETKAYDLAIAVGQNDTERIEYLVNRNPKLLNITNDHTGSNVLGLALYLENFESFKRLLDLGADPNFINPLTKRTPLINACRYYKKPEEYSIDLRYIELLLERGANPNYVVDTSFNDFKGHNQSATSAVHEASGLNLNMLKLLINYGANPFIKLNENYRLPLYSAFFGNKNTISIVNYFIDSLKVDVNETLMKVVSEPSKEVLEYKIQDCITNKYLRAKISGDTMALERQLKENPKLEIENNERWEFIKKLESRGVDFKNYKYKE